MAHNKKHSQIIKFFTAKNNEGTNFLTTATSEDERGYKLAKHLS